jgi:hypothetical protein
MRLNREPAVWVGVADAILNAGIIFNLPGLNLETKTLIAAILTTGAGVLTAYLTKSAMLGVLMGFIKAAFALVGYFVVDFTQDKMTALLAIVPLLAGLFQRTQTSPDPAPSFDEKP